MKSNYSHGLTPRIFKSRSRFDLSHKHITSFNVGDLVPVMIQEVLPGDTFKVVSHNVFRTSTPFVKPVMDNLFFDQYFFFVPLRLVWEELKEFFGENSTGYWAQTEEPEHPIITGEVSPCSIADYLGIPPFVYESGANRYFNELPFRVFATVYNEWFRDQNTQEPVFVSKASGESNSKLNGDVWSTNNIYGMPPKINKLHDYFTSCLPAPQKGDAITLKFGDNSKASNVFNPNAINDNLLVNGDGKLFLDDAGDTTYIDLKGVDIANVNDLRMAFAMQRVLERSARNGSRYIEYIESAFGVTNPDYRLQRPEYLGGKRMPLNIQQVASTNQNDDLDLGDVGAYSLSNGVCGFNKGFTEHGFIISVGAIRYKHTYQQGVERFLTYRNKLDYYDPAFANIGEQPVMKYELDVQHAGIQNDSIFGYNEAWAHLRFKPNRVSGQMRTASGEGFDIWHFADTYGTEPYLNAEFMKETEKFVDRTLSAPSTTINNFIVDFYHQIEAVRCLPTFSIPGLIDHK